MRLKAHDHTTHQPGSFYTGGYGGYGGAGDQGMRPTTRGVAKHVTPHCLTPEWGQSRPSVPPRASYHLGVGTFDVHRTTTDTLTPSSTYSHPVCREKLHPIPASASPSNGTIWSGTRTYTLDAPPPLDFAKSPYSCIPLPPVSPPHSPAPEPPQQRQPTPTLNPVLAYSYSLQCSAQTTFHFHPHNDNRDAPATNPKLGSVTVLLPGGLVGVTVHAAQGRGFVRVGDVLDALDRMFFGHRSLRPLELGSCDACDRGRCGCFCVFGGFRGSILDELRTRYAQAGLVWQEGVDCWELRIA